MADNRSEKSPYKSRFGAGWLPAGAWLAESMCDRIARKDKITLGDFFWRGPRWARTFKAQLIHANKLLQDYSVEAIVAALRTHTGKRVLSLGVAFLRPLIKDEQGKLDRQLPPAPKPTPPNAPAELPRPAFSTKKSLKSLLDETD